jgi:hypothetical protein
MYMTDADVVRVLQKMHFGLRGTGGAYIFLKEPVAEKGWVIDKSESSVVRSDAVWKDIFAKSGV